MLAYNNFHVTPVKLMPHQGGSNKNTGFSLLGNWCTPLVVKAVYQAIAHQVARTRMLTKILQDPKC